MTEYFEFGHFSASTGSYPRFMTSTDMSWDSGAIPMVDSPIITDYTKVEPWQKSRQNKCEYCRSVWHDDGTGSCMSCGAPGGLNEEEVVDAVERSMSWKTFAQYYKDSTENIWRLTSAT